MAAALGALALTGTLAAGCADAGTEPQRVVPVVHPLLLPPDSLAPGAVLTLGVRITDADGAPLQGVAVAWPVVTGGGTTAPPDTASDAHGLASSTWTLGPDEGEQVAEAAVEGATSVRFTTLATWRAAPLQLEPEVSLPALIRGPREFTLSVLVRDGGGGPVSGVRVDWWIREGGGSLPRADTSRFRSDAEGRVTIVWVPGMAPGAQVLEATIEGGATARFSTRIPTSDEPAGICSPSLPCVPPAPRVVDCHAGGVDYTDALPDTLRGGPVRLHGVARVLFLWIEAGTVLCAAPGAGIQVVGHLFALGTAERPVVFTAVDPAAGWNGIGSAELDGLYTVEPRVVLSHVLVEHGGGVRAPELQAGGVRLRQMTGSLSGSGYMSDVALDTVCLDPNFCRAGVDAALEAGTGNRWWAMWGRRRPTTVRRVVVRRSGAAGVAVLPFTEASFADVLVDGAAGAGFLAVVQHFISPGEPDPVRMEGPVVLRGYAGHVAEGGLAAVASFLDGYDSALVAGETVSTLGGGSSIRVPPGLLWLHAQPPWGPGLQDVVVGAGGELRVKQQAPLSVASLHAVGTAEQPARVSGLGWTVGPGALRLEHARLSWTGTLEACGPGQHLSHVAVTYSPVEVSPWAVTPDALRLCARGATVEHVTLDGFGLHLAGGGTTAHDVSVTGAPADGVTIAADSVRLQDCLITGSAGAAVRVTAGAGSRVTRCGLAGNAGVGLANETTDTVDARFNWWGHFLGPHVPGGAGVLGPVDWSYPLPAPPGLPIPLRGEGGLNVRRAPFRRRRRFFEGTAALA